MSRKVQGFGASVLVMALIASVSPWLQAGGGKGGKDKEDMSTIETLILASRMEAHGKETKSPAALLAAGELYWSIAPKSTKELKDVEVKTEDGEGEKGAPAKPVENLKDPRELAHDMFELALDHATPKEKAGVEELIKGIKNTLGSARGPHTINKSIGGNKVQTLSINFKGNQFGQIGFRCNSMVRLHMKVTGPGVKREDTFVFGEITWMAPKNGAVEIKVRNPHKQAAQYTLFVN